MAFFIKKIGKGGFGSCELWQNETGHKFVAKKLLKPWDPKHRKAFEREVAAAQELKHKNIVTVLGQHLEAADPYYTMPYYEGGSLRDKIQSLLEQGTVLPEGAATGIVFTIAGALEFAHAKGIIHRDIKPENILFTADKMLKICDWGIGRFLHRESHLLTQAGLGSPVYCAPEQWATGEGDARSDIYSLGIIYIELLTGNPHPHATLAGLLPGTADVIYKMVARGQRERYQSTTELMADMKAKNLVPDRPMDTFWSDFGKVIGGVALGVAAVALLKAIFD